MISTDAIILVKTWSVGMKHKINEHLCTFHGVIVHVHIQYMCKCIHCTYVLTKHAYVHTCLHGHQPTQIEM